MASGTAPPRPPAPAGSPAPRPSEYDEFIQEQLRRTSTSVKLVDVVSALLRMATVGLAAMLVLVVFDHWVVKGGLGVGLRILAFVLLTAAGGYYFIRRVAPLLIRRINPVFAAQTIEQSSPGLKNSLLNFLFFRQEPQAIHGAVYQAIEQQTAQKLSSTPVDAAVDRGPLIRLGYVLTALVVVTTLYKVLSPKDPFRSIQRVMAPWSDVLAPTRVEIRDIRPGNIEVVRGDKLQVTAEIHGLQPGEPVTLYYSTDDGQAVEQAVPMEMPADEFRHRCVLPAEEGGVHDHLSYRIEAGDAISRTYRATVIAAPTITVRRVTYEYPAYTGLAKRTSTTGDLSALEGTRVTLHAETNQPIKSASLDFNCDGRSDLILKHEGLEATVSFTLALADDGVSPKYTSYALRFTNQQDRANRDPVEHAIQVTPDLAPEITILAPKEDRREAPLDGMVVIETQAIDPDYGLRSVELRGEVGGVERFAHRLLDQEHTGQFQHKYRFVPAREKLKVGDVVEYWATATDNKAPQPNTARTERRRLIITAPEHNPNQPPQPNPAQPQEGEPDGGPKSDQEKSNDQHPGDEEGAQQPGEQGSQQGSGGGEQQAGEEGAGQPQEGQQQEGGQQGGGDQQNEQGQQPGGEQNAGGQPNQGGEQGQPKQGAQGQGGQEGQPNEQGAEGQANQQSQGGGEGEPNAPQDQEGVANDGSDDGGAFEKFLKEMQEQGKSDQSQPGAADGQGGEPGQEGEAAPQGEQRGGQPGASKPSDQKGSQPDGGAPQADGAAPEGQNGGGQKPKSDAANPNQKTPQDTPRGQGDGANGEKTNQKPQGGGNQPPKPSNQSNSGEGGKSQAGGAKPDATQPNGQGAQKPQGQAGEAERAQGDGGAGKPSDDQAGSPESQSDTKPSQQKSPQPNQGEKSSDEQAQSPSHGTKESNSDGSQGGDKSGGGEKGGGQKSPQRGTGSAGQNTAADQGAGQAQDQGAGETSNRPGGDQTSNQNSGQPGPKGQGQNQGAGQSKPGGQSQNQNQNQAQGGGAQGQQPAGGEPTDGAAQPGGQTSDQRGKPAEPNGGQRGGAPGDPQNQAGEPGGDEANLDYARKATDLVLENLKDQLAKDQVDQQMLDRLGWSKEDLRRFVQRWQKMKDAARRPGAEGDAAQDQLNEALRSLGLGRERIRRQTNPNAADQFRDLHESHRVAPPADYAEQFKAYQKGVSRARE